MLRHRVPYLAVAMLLALAASASASSDYWLHVRVDEGRGGAKVSVNLPVSLFQRALPMIPEIHGGKLEIDGHGRLEIDELRAIWQELRNSPDMTLVKVEEPGENVRVWKQAGFFYVDADEEYGDKVNVRLPVVVVDAFLASDTPDFKGALDALIAAGGGELVTVNKDRDGDRVRIWVDRTPEAE